MGRGKRRSPALMPRALFFLFFSPASPRHKGASTEERAAKIIYRKASQRC